MPKQPWKRTTAETLVVLLALYLLSMAINAWRRPETDTATLSRLRGTTLWGVPLSELRRPGRPLLVHFWGTWCPVCDVEAANIETVARHYPVLTVAVTSGSPETIRRWMRRKGVDYPVLNDPDGTLAAHFGVTLYPTTFIFDAAGKVRFVESGYTTTAGLLARMKMAE